MKRAEGMLSAGEEEHLVAIYDAEELPPVGSQLALSILRRLREGPAYPRMLAKELGAGEQAVYYHVRRMEKLGLVRKVGTMSVRGASASLYRAAYDGYAQLFSEAPAVHGGVGTKPLQPPARLYAFFSDMTRGGRLDASIVVGSPEPHGPYRAAARDGHYAAQLALTLGTIAPPSREFAVKLDVDVRAEKAYNSNLILVGGPGTNLVAADVNSSLPVRFKEDNYWMGLIDDQGRAYNEPTDAVIAKVDSPFAPGKKVILVAGVRHIGTKSAVLALSSEHERVLAAYEGRTPFAVVVRGYDQDGDGKVDDVEPIRYY